MLKYIIWPVINRQGVVLSVSAFGKVGGNIFLFTTCCLLQSTSLKPNSLAGDNVFNQPPKPLTSTPATGFPLHFASSIVFQSVSSPLLHGFSATG